jgi:pre-rRNA-processing protein TSR3
MSFVHIRLIFYFSRVYLEKYQTCKSATEVDAMQNAILAELQESYAQAREKNLG